MINELTDIIYRSPELVVYLAGIAVGGVIDVGSDKLYGKDANEIAAVGKIAMGLGSLIPIAFTDPNLARYILIFDAGLASEYFGKWYFQIRNSNEYSGNPYL